ncbi:MAG TPA: tRNA pseudouridine(55) synthase TruB [Actinomycetota bacterium]|nr:tRNA pseudouridine(55) synthase TruB [Actinomycetota bacterium]
MTRAPEGLLLVDKSSGMTSHDAVDVVRRSLGTRKVGHAGTLDPMATGLLVLGVGRATRLLRYLGELPKTYAATGRLGEETDTLDADGEIVRTAPVDVSLAEVERACASLVGESMQTPPAYSAVKVGGRKLYDAARRGEVLEAPARPIRVDAFAVSAFDGRDLEVLITCSGGTYVRVLVADVGRALGCGAHLVRLRRIAIGSFRVEDARPPGEGTLEPVERAVEHLPSIRLDPEEARAASHGRPLGPAGVVGPYAVFAPDDALVGIYRDEGAMARPQVILSGV